MSPQPQPARGWHSRALPLEREEGIWRAAISIGARTDTVWVSTSDLPLATHQDALLPIALEPAMTIGGTLELPAGLSPLLRSSTTKIQDVLRSWAGAPGIPPLERVVIETSDRARAAPAAGRGVGAFFTAGVDSFYTMLKHRDEITHLVYVDRLDVAVDRPALRRASLEHVRAAAAACGKSLVEVDTNVREFSDPQVTWELYHGAALAVVALLLSPGLSKVYLPSSFSIDALEPWGSHPSLDPLWSTEEMTLVHDGAEASRQSKLAALAEHPEVLPWLRVCWADPRATAGAYNCGRCKKCTRTMLGLWQAGVLGEAPSFPNELDLKCVARVDLDRRAFRQQWLAALGSALGARSDVALARALAAALARSAARQPVRSAKTAARRARARHRAAR